MIFPYVGAFTCGYLNEKYILYSAITKQNMNYIIYKMFRNCRIYGKVFGYE